MSTTPHPTVLVIVGITGDLSRRYVLPALEELIKAGAAPEQFRIIGVTRRDVPPAELCAKLATPGDHRPLLDHLEMRTVDLARLEDYVVLKEYVDHVRQQLGADAKVVFYLSVPPQVSQPIIRLLGESGIAPSISLLLEKPFGTDLTSAEELVTDISKHFREEQVYRVDHYLAKEMVQNLLVFRERNALFKRTWNNSAIASIDIIASEKIGIEGRVEFYEQAGALRDYQSHLLQLAALVLMPSVDPGHKYAIPTMRLKALRHLHVPADKPVTDTAKRGQYEGYREEVGNPDSTVETFMNLTLASDDPAWKGVPIRLITGKSLDERFTDVLITYKKDNGFEPDQLRIRVQPDTGISLDLWTKAPGYEQRVEKRSLKMTYQDHYASMPQAYEQVFLDAITANRSLFVSGDEVLESWRIMQPIQKAWENSAKDLRFYTPGTRYINI